MTGFIRRVVIRPARFGWYCLSQRGGAAGRMMRVSWNRMRALMLGHAQRMRADTDPGALSPAVKNGLPHQAGNTPVSP